jgi:hypothetical protein
MSDQQPAAEAAAPRRTFGRGVVAGVLGAGVVAALVFAGFAIARAAGSPSPSFAGPGGLHAHGRAGGRPGRLPFRGGLHGEFTVPAPGGGSRTITVESQFGRVAGVTGSTLTVRSVDGFTRTYHVDAHTFLAAGGRGLAGLAQGELVRVVAVAGTQPPRAVAVVDVSVARNVWRTEWPRGLRGTPPAA